MIDAALLRDGLVIIDATAAVIDHAVDADAQPTVSTMAAATLLAIAVTTLTPVNEQPTDLLADLRRHVEDATRA